MEQSLHPLMILGAASNAGKSFVTTAFCRWLARQGYKVHPFKAQNMSLNAMVTPVGDEIGVAQYSQALASEQIPRFDHNPILLKPQRGMTSQVILKGKLYETSVAKDYQENKDFFASQALESYRKLEGEADIVVLEGAGSPVELNLMDRDIANLYMAQKADAKCLLVVNIEWGGFFAAAKGTFDLIPDNDKKRILGVIVNKFRGDASLFLKDLSTFEKQIGIPVLGVLPHLDHLALDIEDGVSLDSLGSHCSEAVVKIRIIRLPHIANFNEFQIFDHCRGVDWSFVDDPFSLSEADMVIVPGTKMTVKDLSWMRSKKMDTAIRDHVDKGKQLIGICGGFQMLGETLYDPNGVEDPSIKRSKGLGFFEMDTTFLSQKTLNYVSVTDQIGGQQMQAYEIHMGEGKPSKAIPQLMICQRNGRKEMSPEGWMKDNIFGTYLHGLFENRVMLGKFFPSGDWPDMHQLREKTFDLIADALEKNIDMKRLMNMISRK